MLFFPKRIDAAERQRVGRRSNDWSTEKERSQHVNQSLGKETRRRDSELMDHQIRSTYSVSWPSAEMIDAAAAAAAAAGHRDVVNPIIVQSGWQ